MVGKVKLYCVESCWIVSPCFPEKVRPSKVEMCEKTRMNMILQPYSEAQQEKIGI